MITSKSNEIIKKCIQIKQKKYSKETKLCFVESIKLVRELSSKGLIDIVLVIEDKYELCKNFTANRIELISIDIAKYLSDTVTTDGVFGICLIPNSNNLDSSRCLLLDRIQDPSNLGAIIRSASAFGFTSIYAIDSVYPYSFKSIRSSMGNIFNVNYFDVSIDDFMAIKNDKNLKLYVADMDGEEIQSIDCGKDNICVVIGNEGQGVDSNITSICDKVLSIPMQNNVESLNASVSAGIIMYLLRK